MRDKAVKASLRKASRESVEGTWIQLKSNITKEVWIGKRNRYRTRTIQFLSKDTKPGRTVNGRHLAQYIAASAPLHCADGWSLLGRALDCHGRGDAEACRHLAYYAELRAALSLLAAEGIGVFNDRHFVIETPTTCSRIPNPRKGRLPTHYIAWEALEHWADLNRSATLLAEIVNPGGVSLGEWVKHFQAGPSFHPVGRRWLKTWGLDLKQMSNDREARNESSYRPSRFIPEKSLSALTASDFTCSLWSLCEPSGHSRFESLDRHLLRVTLEEVSEAFPDRAASKDPAAFRKTLSSMLNKMGFDESSQVGWRRFLAREAQAADPSVLTAAKQVTAADNPQNHIQMVSRATLLLRVATGACERLLSAAGLTREQLRFWWLPVGKDRGLWDAASEPDQLTDLWADAESAIEQIRAWRVENAADDPSVAKWRHERPYEISVLGGCERIALWGLGL